ncbi:MAG TPA: TIGR01777 family oxidoreductase [Kofleriaceae bacterium]|nr:TIGR01777 family oxidoreductase [Kofleriaceae bacterium]
MKIIVTGATGFVGAALCKALVERGDQVIALSRDAARAKAKLGPSVEVLEADLETVGPWGRAFANAGAILHLAGESVGAKRWDARQKQVIRDSRVETTRTIVEAIAELDRPDRPKTLICASGTDYYPFALPPIDDDEVTEIDPPSDSFLGRVCRDWEKEARGAEPLGVRVAMLRTGIVLGHGGPLDKMTTPFKLFAGGKLGNGEQWMPWIHLDDVVAAYATAAHDARYAGPINLVTDSVRNREFAAALGRALGRPSWLRTPKLAIKAALGEFSEYVLHGRRVVPARLRELGFQWKYPALEDALRAAI